MITFQGCTSYPKSISSSHLELYFDSDIKDTDRKCRKREREVWHASFFWHSAIVDLNTAWEGYRVHSAWNELRRGRTTTRLITSSKDKMKSVLNGRTRAKRQSKNSAIISSLISIQPLSEFCVLCSLVAINFKNGGNGACFQTVSPGRHSYTLLCNMKRHGSSKKESFRKKFKPRLFSHTWTITA